MWARTWYGPNALDTPLRDYYVPRTPVDIDCANYAGGLGSQNGGPEGAPNQYGARPYPATAAYGFEPTQFERLGKIPNELDALGAGFPPGGPAPVAASRR
jgi:hypothetical protein